MIGVRIATEADLESVTRIYNYYVAETVVTFDIDPFTVEGRRPWFSRFDATHPLWVYASATGSIEGYAYYLPFRPKPAYDGTKECTVYVAAGRLGRGIGSALYSVLTEHARSAGVRVLIGVLGGTNPASEALHRRFGFEYAGSLRKVGLKFGELVDTHYFQKVFEPPGLPVGTAEALRPDAGGSREA